MTFATYPSLKARGVFITGGSTGIGASLVEHFCAQGSKVAFVGLNEKAGTALCAAMTSKKYPTPLFIACDLRNIDALKQAIATANTYVDGIRVLVNNAADDARHHTPDVTVEQWDNIMNVNLRHQFFAAQAVQPIMAKLGGGSIINMGSNCFMLGQQGDYPGYMTAKAAIMGLTRALATEFGPQKIRVNSLLPGWVMTEKQIEKWLTPEAEQDLMRTQALKEKLYPPDIARMTLFLAADDSRLCSKQCFIVDAGRT